MSTIAAISTAPGIGGIGIIRMSGENCFEILNTRLFPICRLREDAIIMCLNYVLHPKSNNCRVESRLK